MPVLSVHSTSIAPKFWIALSCLTTTLRRLIASAPLARLAVTISGSISGVRPTATEIANRNASRKLPLSHQLIAKTTGTITAMIRISSHDTLFTPRSKLVSARWPVSVRASEPR